MKWLLPNGGKEVGLAGTIATKDDVVAGAERRNLSLITVCNE